uniref:Uncharacterized protein n=1 Tax=Anguilla anguilla TaxID=7936 RepID=A0A0E9UGL8_ANGAN
MELKIPRVLLKTCSASNRNVLADVSNARQIKQNIPLREINTFYVIRLEASVYFWSLKEGKYFQLWQVLSYSHQIELYFLSWKNTIFTTI